MKKLLGLAFVAIFMMSMSSNNAYSKLLIKKDTDCVALAWWVNDNVSTLNYEQFNAFVEKCENL